MPDVGAGRPEEPGTEDSEPSGRRDPGSAPAGPPRSTGGVPAWLVTAAAISWRALAVGAAVLVAARVFAELYLAAFPVIIALFIATLLGPPAAWLKRRGLPRSLAALLVVLAALFGLVGVFGVIIPTVVDELRDFGPELQEGWNELLDWLVEGPLGLTAAEISGLLDRAAQELQENLHVITTGVVTGAILALEIVAGTLLALVLVFFFVKDGDRIIDYLLARTPGHLRDDVRAAGRRAWTTLTGYIRGTALIALVDAVGIGIGLVLIGVPLALPLVVLVFFGGFFPIVGATVTGLLAVLVALVSLGFTEALLTLAVVILVQQVESNVLEPVVMSRAVRLHPVVVLFVLTAGGLVAGIVGAFLAVPIAAVVAAVGNELRLRHEARHAPVA